jgi:hypothetical protein
MHHTGAPVKMSQFRHFNVSDKLSANQKELQDFPSARTTFKHTFLKEEMLAKRVSLGYLELVERRPLGKEYWESLNGYPTRRTPTRRTPTQTTPSFTSS